MSQTDDKKKMESNNDKKFNIEDAPTKTASVIVNENYSRENGDKVIEDIKKHNERVKRNRVAAKKSEKAKAAKSSQLKVKKGDAIPPRDVDPNELSRQDRILRNDFNNWVYISAAGSFFNTRIWNEFARGDKDKTTGSLTMSVQSFNAMHKSIFKSYPPISEWFFDGYPICDGVEPVKYRDFIFQPGMSQDNDSMVFNRWIEPVAPVAPKTRQEIRDLAKFLSFVKSHFSNVREYRIFMDYVYYTLIFPGTKIHHGLILLSPNQGTGKTMLMETMMRSLLGYKMVSKVDMKEAGSDFDSYKVGVKLVYLSELKALPKKALNEMLLDLMTDDITKSVSKGKDPIEVWNYITVFATSNDRVPINLKKGDRRWTVIESVRPVIEDKEKDIEFFTAMAEFIKEKPGIIHWYYKNRWAQKYPDRMFSPKSMPPMTQAKQNIIDASESSVETVLHDFIEEWEGMKRRVFLHSDLKKFAVHHKDDYQELVDYIGTEKNLINNSGAIGVTVLGRCTRKKGSRPVNKTLFGIPNCNYSGLNSGMAADEYVRDGGAWTPDPYQQKSQVQNQNYNNFNNHYQNRGR